MRLIRNRFRFASKQNNSMAHLSCEVPIFLAVKLQFDDFEIDLTVTLKPFLHLRSGIMVGSGIIVVSGIMVDSGLMVVPCLSFEGVQNGLCNQFISMN